MPSYDPNDTVRECVSCKLCYPANMQFCRDCLIELTSVELIPYVVNDRYRLEWVVSRGGTGVVFAATNMETGREVAIKVLRASVMADPRAQDRLQREAQIAIGFSDPQIGAVYDFGFLADASAYIVSEYVKGGSLRSEMNKAGKFSVEKTVEIIVAACEALDAAHKAGLVHRDLKPESIILLPTHTPIDSKIKIVDFSYSKFATGQAVIPGTTGRLQGQGQLPLRPTYLSPEQFRGEEADLRSDIYSLGVIAYEMLCGQPPFQARRSAEFGMKLLNTRPQSLRSQNPEINLVLEAEIFRALEKDPMNRQQNGLDFARKLHSAMHMN
jgi:eukaryotic-like serine/threonine-protein kinase